MPLRFPNDTVFPVFSVNPPKEVIADGITSRISYRISFIQVFVLTRGATHCRRTRRRSPKPGVRNKQMSGTGRSNATPCRKPPSNPWPGDAACATPRPLHSICPILLMTGCARQPHARSRK